MFTFLVGTVLFIGSIIWLAKRVKRSSSSYLHYSDPIKDDTDTYKSSNWGASSYSSNVPTVSQHKPKSSTHRVKSSSSSFKSGGFGNGSSGGGGSSNSW